MLVLNDAENEIAIVVVLWVYGAVNPLKLVDDGAMVFFDEIAKALRLRIGDSLGRENAGKGAKCGAFS